MNQNNHNENIFDTPSGLPLVVNDEAKFLSIPLDSSTTKTFTTNLNQSWSTLLAAFVIALVVTTWTYQLPYENSYNKAQVTAVVPVNLINLTNEVRAENNLNALSPNEQLNAAAAAKVKAIFASQYFSHTGKNGEKFSSWIKNAGYTNYEIVGENLALGYFEQQAMMDAWMASPKHKENIVGPFYNEIGMAAATGDFHGKETTIVVQLFGKQIEQPQTSKNTTITANIIR